MPHVTYAYPFEQKIFDFAENFSKSLSGGNRTFVMIFNGTGAVQTIIVKKPSASTDDITNQLKEIQQPHFIYDPFDAPKHTWISWFMVKRSTLERFIDQRFEYADFEKNASASEWSPELKPENIFPVSWGVMF
ncbi:hypothetical protein ACFL7E_01850 [Thermodesulfobacteriota bacterium]